MLLVCRQALGIFTENKIRLIDNHSSLSCNAISSSPLRFGLFNNRRYCYQWLINLGSMIPHATRSLGIPAQSPLSFPITMIQAPFLALPMLLPRGLYALLPGRAGAFLATVNMAAITRPTKAKPLPAKWALQQNKANTIHWQLPSRRSEHQWTKDCDLRYQFIRIVA